MKYKNKGLVHAIEASYGYQLGNGKVVYKNLGYREYTTLHPVEINYTLSYRFVNWVSLGIGTGIQYQLKNLCLYGDVFDESYAEQEKFSPLNIPLFLNTKVYLSRGSFQPLLSFSGGIYFPNIDGMFDAGFGANLRLSRTANMYFLASCRLTPYGRFYKYGVTGVDHMEGGIGQRPVFSGYDNESVWTPTFKVGFTF